LERKIYSNLTRLKDISYTPQPSPARIGGFYTKKRKSILKKNNTEKIKKY
jgi:hypothetical protein